MSREKNKLLIIGVLLTAMSIFLITGCSKEGEDENKTPSKTADKNVYSMKLAHITTKENPLNIGYEYLAEQLKTKTNGQIILNIYGNGQISGSDREQAEMVQNNIIQMTSTPSYTLAGMNSELKKFNIYDVPYLFANDDEISSFSDGPVGAEMVEDLLKGTGIRAYGPFSIGWVKISSNKQPIQSPDDLKGLNIRTTKSEFYMKTTKAWGANPTPVAYGECFTALQQGTVDGMMTACSLYVTDRFYEVQKYLGAVNPFAITHYPIINNNWYERLPDDLQKIFDECMVDYVNYMREIEKKAESDSLDILREKGMVVNEYTEEQMRLFSDPAKPMWEESANIVGGIEFLNSVREFLNK